MQIIIDEMISLTEFRESDRKSLIQNISDPEIYKNTLKIPYPYTDKDFDEWLKIMSLHWKKESKPYVFAIRHKNHDVIGGTGFLDFIPDKTHKAEIGYWLGKNFWGQGIMTNVINRMCEYGFDRLNLVRITANIFTFNKASARVAEKCGFQKEGLLRKNHLKDGKYIDSYLYALIKEE